MEHTTITIKADLKDQLNIFKIKYQMKNLNQVVQLLYNIKNKDLLHQNIKDLKQENIEQNDTKKKELFLILQNEFDFELCEIEEFKNYSINDLQQLIKNLTKLKK
jgi:hypothetical protein